MALSSVDLPQPEGPSTTNRSPRTTSKLTRYVAVTSCSPVRYCNVPPLTDSSTESCMAAVVYLGLVLAWHVGDCRARCWLRRAESWQSRVSLDAPTTRR